MIKFEQQLPVLMMLLNITASLVYLSHGDTRKFVYWIAAAVLTATVTF